MLETRVVHRCADDRNCYPLLPLLALFTAVYTAGSMTFGLHFLFGPLRAVTGFVLTSVFTVPFFCDYTILLVGTSHILSLLRSVLSLWFFRKYLLCRHLEWPAAQLGSCPSSCPTPLLSCVRLSSWWSTCGHPDATSDDVCHLLYIDLVRPGTRGLLVSLLFFAGNAWTSCCCLLVNVAANCSSDKLFTR